MEANKQRQKMKDVRFVKNQELTAKYVINPATDGQRLQMSTIWFLTN